MPLPPPPHLGQGAIRLAPFFPEHINPRYLAWINDSQVMRFTEAGRFTHTRESAAAYIEDSNTSDNSRLWRIMAEPEGHVGTLRLTALDLHHRHTQMALIVGVPALWGRGIARTVIALACDYCFFDLGLHKISAYIHPDNGGSLRAFKICGFDEEARLKDQIFHDGRFCDVLVLARFAKR